MTVCITGYLFLAGLRLYQNCLLDFKLVWKSYVSTSLYLNGCYDESHFTPVS